MNFIVRTWEWELHQPDTIQDYPFSTLNEAKEFYELTKRLNKDRLITQARIELLIILDSYTFK